MSEKSNQNNSIRRLSLTFFMCLTFFIILTFLSVKTTYAASALTNTSKSQATVTVRQVNSWQSEGKWFYQYEIILTNGKKLNLKSWAFKLMAPNNKPWSNSFWNCKLKVKGRYLTVSNVGYNGKVAKNKKVQNIGCIVRFSRKTTNFAGTYKYSTKYRCFVRKSSSTKAPASTGSKTSKTSKSGTAASKTGSNSTGSAGKTPSSTSKSGTTGTSTKPASVPSASAGSAYTKHGKLSVSGTNLVDKNGNVFQLKGVSTHGIAWYPKYVNESAFKTLRDSWGVNTVRLAMYTAEYGGYCNGGSKSTLESTIDKGVQAASKLGMYVIIDWHILSDGNPNTHKKAALDFFSRMSVKYKNYGNVLFEICNEPNGGTSWSQVKSYANDVIATIRKNSDAVILVGTPTWSQDVDQVINNQVKSTKNVMYTLHFYAGTHGGNIRSKLTKARKAGIPVFISEFSICDASGNGGINYSSAAAWKKLINDNKISYCGWSLCNKNETSALIKSSVSKTSGWSWNDLSKTGQWLMTMTSGK